MERTKEVNQRRLREGLCTFTAFLPMFGFFGFLHMGHRSGRTQYTRFGLVYAVLIALVSGFYTVIALLNPDMVGTALGDIGSKLTTHYFFFLNVICNIGNREIYTLALLLNTSYIVLCLSCLIHTLYCRNGYLNYLEQAVWPYESAPAAPIEDKRWRRKNRLWMLWGIVPVINGTALHFIGSKTGKRRLKITGLLITLASIFCAAARVTVRSLAKMRVIHTSHYDGLDRSIPMAVAIVLIVLLYYLCIMLMFLYRRDCLTALSAQWETDIRTSPSYADAGWRRANSGWQIVTAIPFLGGIGIMLSGIKIKDRHLLIQGAILTLIPITAVALYLRLFFETNLIDVFGYFGFVVRVCWGISAYIGCLNRRHILLRRAALQGGYLSDLDQEIAQVKRYHNRGGRNGAEGREGRAVAPPEPMEEKVPVPHSATQTQTEAKNPDVIDINACTQEDLRRLPGVGVAEAKRAMEYRTEHGGFRSVDEFVEAMSLKPHFAIQVFQMVSVSQRTSEAASHQMSAEHRRRRSLDL